MRQRLSSKFITFNPVKGKDFYDKFFTDGKVKKEEAIESIYNMFHFKATNNKVEIIKESGYRGTTDGFITAYADVAGKEVPVFYGIQECKRDIKRGSAAYYQQIAQALLYAVQFEEEMKVLLIPSVNYIDYIFMDEISINKEELLDLLKDNSPCKACKYVTGIKDFKVHQVDMPTEAKLDETWKTIYKHCIEI